MKLMINHQTHYEYSDAVQRSIQYIKMMPSSNDHQKVERWDISVPGQKMVQRDAFNNLWLTTTQVDAYQYMTIMAQGIVELNVERETGIEDAVNPYLFLQPTPSTLCNDAMREFVKVFVPRIHRGNLIHLAEALLKYLPYTPTMTDVHTTAIDAFERRMGVCQDHSHVFIAMCRYLGVPARYVSGYLFAENQTHLASHAWAEVYLDQKWYCFDVSNQLFQPSAHIYVAIGRDYWDVAPIRGVREKGGHEYMKSVVQVLCCS
jgi:transglutaminase-like putative cysteine protease